VAATAPAAIPEAAPEYRRPEHVPEYRSPEPAPEYRSPEPEPWARDEQPRAMPPPPPPAPPPPNLDAVLRESGLVMIETVRGQAPAPEPEEEPQGRRPRRERRAPPAGLDEPLEQVETRGDDGKPEPRLP
jgi:hypothetical protein